MVSKVLEKMTNLSFSYHQTLWLHSRRSGWRWCYSCVTDRFHLLAVGPLAIPNNPLGLELHTMEVGHPPYNPMLVHSQPLIVIPGQPHPPTIMGEHQHRTCVQPRLWMAVAPPRLFHPKGVMMACTLKLLPQLSPVAVVVRDWNLSWRTCVFLSWSQMDLSDVKCWTICCEGTCYRTLLMIVNILIQWAF